MKEKLRSFRKPSPGRIEVIVALIGAIGAILAAVITVGLPIIVGQNDESLATVTPSMPANPPAVPEPSSPPAVPEPSSPPVMPAPAEPPAGVASFPCDATVSSWNAVDLNVVRDFPNQGALLREPVKVGAAVRVIDISGTDPPWYRIAGPEGRVLGWIPAEYLSLAATCPQP